MTSTYQKRTPFSTDCVPADYKPIFQHVMDHGKKVVLLTAEVSTVWSKYQVLEVEVDCDTVEKQLGTLLGDGVSILFENGYFNMDPRPVRMPVVDKKNDFFVFRVKYNDSSFLKPIQDGAEQWGYKTSGKVIIPVLTSVYAPFNDVQEPGISFKMAGPLHLIL